MAEYIYNSFVYAWTSEPWTRSQRKTATRFLSFWTSWMHLASLESILRSTYDTLIIWFTSPKAMNGKWHFELAMARSNGWACLSASPTHLQHFNGSWTTSLETLLFTLMTFGLQWSSSTQGTHPRDTQVTSPKRPLWKSEQMQMAQGFSWIPWLHPEDQRPENGQRQGQDHSWMARTLEG